MTLEVKNIETRQQLEGYFNSRLPLSDQNLRVISGAWLRIFARESQISFDSIQDVMQAIDACTANLFSNAWPADKYRCSLYLLEQKDNLEKSTLPLLAAAWLRLKEGVREPFLALQLCENSSVPDSQNFRKLWIRAMCNMDLGDLTDVLDDLVESERLGGEREVVNFARRRYFTLIGEQSSENVEEAFPVRQDLIAEKIRSQDISDKDSRRKLHEKLRSEGLGIFEMAPPVKKYVDSLTLKEFRDWRISSVSILDDCPEFLNKDIYTLFCYHRAYAGMFKLVMTKDDLDYYVPIFTKLSTYSATERIKAFDVNPSVWLYQVENRLDPRYKSSLVSPEKKKSSPLPYDDDTWLDAYDAQREAEIAVHKPLEREIYWNEETEEWSWWDQI